MSGNKNDRPKVHRYSKIKSGVKETLRKELRKSDPSTGKTPENDRGKEEGGIVDSHCTDKRDGLPFKLLPSLLRTEEVMG